MTSRRTHVQRWLALAVTAALVAVTTQSVFDDGGGSDSTAADWDLDDDSDFKGPHDPALDDYFRNLLEGLRVIMPVGFPDFGLPVLEPLTLDEQDVDYDNGLGLRLQALLRNVSAQRLSTFEIPRLRVSLPGFQLHLTLRVPDVEAQGWYRLRGSVLHGGVGFRGEGLWRVRILDLRVKADVQLIDHPDGKVVMQMLALRGDMARFDSHFDNLLGEGNLSEVVNAIVRRHSRNFMGLVLDRIRQPVDQALERITDIVDSTIFTDFGGGGGTATASA